MIHILNAEIYNVRVKDCHWPLLGSAGSIVTNVSHVTNKNHMLFMDRFYNSVTIFHLKNELGVLVGGTLMPSHKHYPKELGKRLTKRGQYEFRCRGGLCAIAWKDGKPIHFLSNYHDPRGASTVNMRMWDRLTQTLPAAHQRQPHSSPPPQSDLHMQGVGQHHPECSPAATDNNLCVVCCTK